MQNGNYGERAWNIKSQSSWQMDAIPVDYGADQNVETGNDGGVDRTFLRCRSFKEPLPEPVLDALARHESEGMMLESFGEGRRFTNSSEFLTEWRVYEGDTLSTYQSRGADTARAVNEKRKRDFIAAGLSLDTTAFKDGLIPEELGHATITRRCKHGVFRRPRGNGTREVKVSHFIACPARITGSAERDDDGIWGFFTKNEFSYHNHKCTQAMIDSYGHSALLTHPEIARDVTGYIQAGAKPRNICDTISTNYGINLTPKHIANFRRDRLGDQAALTNFSLLLQRFAAFPGSRCLIVNDQNGNVCAAVTQSAAQRDLFKLYGDNLILDWTHNTNNLGFFLGSLVATSVSGKGVSVCDFLCIEQTEEMMATVFQYFIDVNPESVDKVVSFVIDKDYKEWRVLERLFPKSAVLLCQFHVKKWFAYVVTMRKYDLSTATRDQVLSVLSHMIYASTTTSFDVLVDDLHRLLADISPAFLNYMQTRWYTCRRMWSNCERSSRFTALNTTSNRIESIWNQIKSFLGRKLRIDLCLQSVFAYQTAVLRREYRIISNVKHALVLRSEVPRFIRSAMAQVCDFVCTKVSSEWKSFRDATSADSYIWWMEGQDFRLTRGGADAATYNVDSDLRYCSCAFSLTSDLPCRHIIFVAHSALQLPEFPCERLHPRWVLKNAFAILPGLKACADLIQTLRTTLLVSETAFTALADPDFVEPIAQAEPPAAQFRAIAYRRMSSFQRSEVTVLTDLQKRGILESTFDKTIDFLMSQSTPAFLKLAAELEAVLAERMQLWTEQGPVTLEETGSERAEPPRGAEHAGSSTQALSGPEHADGAGGGGAGVGEVGEMGEMGEVGEVRGSLESDNGSVSSDAGGASVSTTCMSALLNPIVEAELDAHADAADAPCASISLDSVAVSSIMRGVAEHQLRTDARPTTPPTQLKPKRRARPTNLDYDWIKELGDDSDYAAELADMVFPNRGEHTPGQVTKRTVQLRATKGTTKKQKTGGITGRRIAYAIQESPIPVDLSSLCGALRHTTDLSRVADLCKKYPRRFDERWVADSSCVASVRAVRVRDFRVNFRVKRSLVEKMRRALNMVRHDYTALGSDDEVLGPCSPRSRGLVDLTDASSDPSHGPTARAIVSQAVVSLGPELRSFSRDNVEDFESYFALVALCRTYKADLRWVEKGDGNESFDVPYQQLAITSRGLDAGQSVSCTARRSIAAVMSSCTASTVFRIRTLRRDLAMSITVSEIIGFLARTARLNDCVMMYALRQMASDYPGVHVVECLDAPSRYPSLSVEETEWVLFPWNFSRVHWSIIAVHMRYGMVGDVLLYDPLQGRFEDSLRGIWETSCIDYIWRWSARDGRDPSYLSRVQPQCLAAPPQHDSDSCGIYCISMAHELMTESAFFLLPDCPQEAAFKELRVRLLWRIFCDSERHDDTRAQAEARPVVDVVEAIKDPPKTLTLSSSRLVSRKARDGSNWRA